jgi:hypothetical protein
MPQDVEVVDAEGFPVPRCAWHPDRTPVAACVVCGRTMCRVCATRLATGFRCPECRALSPAPAEEPDGTSRVARLARLNGLIGLIPVIGSPAAAAAVVLAAAALRGRASRVQPGARQLAATLALGLAGLAGTAVVVWFLVRGT